MNKSQFEVFKGHDGQFYFRLRAENGEIVCQSEGCTTRVDARRGVMTVISIVTLDIVQIVDLDE